ncbi:MAG: hypothetical protein RPU62_10155 [Candidatus Sedimenticola sp. (ex Thyasira tokunagai)]
MSSVDSDDNARKNGGDKIKVSHNIAVLRPKANHEQNLKEYIEDAKDKFSRVFCGVVASWSDVVWDITGSQSTQSATKSTARKNVLFTQSSGLGRKIKSSASDQLSFDEPFMSFAKAYVVHRQYRKTVTSQNHMEHVILLRRVYEQLIKSGSSKCITSAHQGLFRETARGIVSGPDRLSTESSQYKSVNILKAIANELDEHKLTKVPIEFKSNVSRPNHYGGHEHARGDKQSKLRRAEKLPKTTVLLFLAALWKHYDELEERDKDLTCIAVILMIMGFRMDEVVGLDINCIPTKEEFEKQSFEIDPKTGVMVRILSMRVIAKKGAGWQSKQVPIGCEDIIFTAVQRLSDLSKNMRDVAKALITQKKCLLLDVYADKEVVTSSELHKAINPDSKSKSTSNLITSLERIGVIFDKTSRPARANLREVNNAIYQSYRESIPTLMDGVGVGGFSIPLYELLNLRFLHEYGKKSSLLFYPVPVSATQVQDYLRGREPTSHGKAWKIKSVFERYDFDEIGEMTDTVSSHAFRHLLNTIMQESDQFSEEDIAKNFLRTSVKDNVSYNHQIEMGEYRERAIRLQTRVLSKINVTEDSAKEAIRRFPTLSHEELEQDLDDMGSYHFMTIGRCHHDYSQEPCGRHYSCLRGCNKYKRKKGSESEVTEITLIRDRAIKQMEVAAADADSGFYGASNWYKSHELLVDGCNTALGIESDPQYQMGDVVHVFPHGDDHCEAAQYE